MHPWRGTLLLLLPLLLLGLPRAWTQTQQPPVGGGGPGGATTIVVNVQDPPYNATGDGTTDDTAAVLSAFTAAPDGSTIYFPQGTYVLDALVLTNRHRLRVTGEGRASILKRKVQASGNIAAILYFSGSGNTDIQVDTLAFDLNNCLSFCGGPKFGQVQRFKLLNTYIYDSNINTTNTNDKFGLLVTGVGDGTRIDALIQGNVLDDVQMEVDNVSGVLIVDNVVNRPRSTAGIGLFSQSGSSGARVENVVIQRNIIRDVDVSAGGIVVHLDPPSSTNYTYRNISILDNQIEWQATKTAVKANNNAIRVGTANQSTATTGNVFDGITIARNTIWGFDSWDGALYGVRLLSSATANFFFDNVQIVGNTFRQSTGHTGNAAELTRLRTGIVHGNLALNMTTGTVGWNITGTDDVTFSNNTIQGAAGAFPVSITNTGGFGNNLVLRATTARGPTTALYTFSGGQPASSRTLYDLDYGTLAARPATCTLPQMYFVTDATAGLNLFGCTATNTWTLLGDGNTVTGIDTTQPYTWTGMQTFGAGITLPSTQHLIIGSTSDGARLKYSANGSIAVRNAADSGNGALTGLAYTASQATGSLVGTEVVLASTTNTSATPAAGLIRSQNASGTNSTGSTLTMTASLGTGTGGAGTLAMRAAPTKAASGSGSHAAVTLLTVGHPQTAHPGTAGGLLNVPAVTFTDENTAGSGTAAMLALTALQQPTIAARNTAVTTTEAATLYIANAPAPGTNMTLTRPLALQVAAGDVSLGSLKTTGAAGGKRTVCVDTATGILYASSTSTDCSN